MRNWFYRSGWRLVPGFFAACLALLADRSTLIHPLENLAYRTLFHVRGEQPWDERVAVIEIDESSLAGIGQFPWPRRYYTDLLKQLTPAQNSVVVFDILFAESSQEDGDLAAAMATHGNVVLATAWDGQRGVIGPNASVVEGAIATGHIHHQSDVDGITRSYQPKINGTQALSIAAVTQYSNGRLERFPPNSAHRGLWLNWRGPTHRAPRYSFADVLSGRIPGSALANKIIFIGFTGEELDTMATPYDSNSSASGVYQHVVAANNLLAQNHLQTIIWPVNGTIVLVNVALGYGLLHCRFKGRLLGILGILFIWGSLVVVAFSYNYWLPTVTPLLSFSTTGVLVVIFSHLQLGINSFRRIFNVRSPVAIPAFEPVRYQSVSWSNLSPSSHSLRLLQEILVDD